MDKEYLTTFYNQIKTDNNKESFKEKSGESLDKKIDDSNEALKKSEDQKYKFRGKISIFTAVVLTFQLIFFNVIIGIIICSIIGLIKTPIVLSAEVIANLLSFLKYYISATIVELLGMWFFITKYAFSRVDTYGKSKKKKKKRNKDKNKAK